MLSFGDYRKLKRKLLNDLDGYSNGKVYYRSGYPEPEDKEYYHRNHKTVEEKKRGSKVV